MATLWNPHKGKPVNGGEGRVVEVLVECLPDDYYVIPSLLMYYKTDTDEIDAIVVGPQIVAVIETKDYRGDVIFNVRSHRVDGEGRPEAVAKTLSKAKRVKGKLWDTAEALRQVWVVHQVVLARQPKNLHVDPPHKKWVSLIDSDACQRLADPKQLLLEGAELTDVPVEQVLQALDVHIRPRRGSERFGAYRTTSLVKEDETGRLYEAEEIVTERPFMLRLHVIDPFLPKVERERKSERALTAYRVLTELAERVGHIPQVIGPEITFTTENGDVVTISPLAIDPSLRDLHDEEARLSEKELLAVVRDVAVAAQAVHMAGMAHRHLTPDVVHVDRSAEDLRGCVARVGGWDRAGTEESAQGTVHSTMVAGDPTFVAPELVGGEVESWQAVDLWTLGSTTRWLWTELGDSDVGPLPPRLEDIVRILTEPDPTDREASSASEMAQAATNLLAGLFEEGGDSEPTPAPDPEAVVLTEGGRIGAHYTVVEVLGWGATSTVVSVDHLWSGKRFAVKVFDEGTVVEQAVAEFLLLLAVAHPNVVRVHDVFPVGGRKCLKMELLTGPTLRERLDDDGPVDGDTLDQWLGCLLGALDALHRAGLVHRDLKPENVVIEPRDRGPVLVDFGLASDGVDMVAGGTARYRPAMAEAGAAEPSLDLFALAVMTHEVRTGIHPFGDAPTCMGEPAIDTSIPEPLRSTLATAMAADPAARFTSVAKFRAALRGHDEAEPEKIPPPDSGPAKDSGIPIGPKVTLEVLPGREVHRQAQTPGGESDVEATISAAVLRSGPDVRLDIEWCEAVNGERWVRAVDAHSSPACVHRLTHGLRPGIHPVPGRNDVVYMELRQARIVDDPDWPRVRKVPIEDLDEGAGTDLTEILLGNGAEIVATREDAWGDTGRRRTQLCVVFDPTDPMVAFVAYALTRLAPLIEVQKRPVAEPTPTVSSDGEAEGDWPSLDTRMSKGKGGLGDRYLPSYGYWVCHERHPWRIPRMPFARLETALFGKDGARAICAGEGRVADRTAKWGSVRLVVVRVGDVALLTDGSEVALLPWERVPPKDAEAAIRGFENATARRPLEESAFD